MANSMAERTALSVHGLVQKRIKFVWDDESRKQTKKKAQAEEEVTTTECNSPCPRPHLKPATAAVTPVPPPK